MWNDVDGMRTELVQAVKHSGSQKNFASKHKLSPSYINDVLRNRREVSARLAKILGYERHVMYWQSLSRYMKRKT